MICVSENTKREEKNILIEARKKLGLTQRQVADKADVAMRHYQMFQGGKRNLSSASFWTAGKILQALERDISDFARGDYAKVESDGK